jgi:hypothetical protein
VKPPLVLSFIITVTYFGFHSPSFRRKGSGGGSPPAFDRPLNWWTLLRPHTERRASAAHRPRSSRPDTRHPLKSPLARGTIGGSGKGRPQEVSVRTTSPVPHPCRLPWPDTLPCDDAGTASPCQSSESVHADEHPPAEITRRACIPPTISFAMQDIGAMHETTVTLRQVERG